jgi:hypothetical protein
MAATAPMRHDSVRVRLHPAPPAAMRLDPNTHTFVLATAFITSLAFAVLAMNLLAGVLYYTIG